MVEKKGLGKAIGHAFLWFGIAIVLFPLYIALVATTHTFDVLIGSTPLWFGGEFLKNFTTVLTQGLKAAGEPQFHRQLPRPCPAAHRLGDGDLPVPPDVHDHPGGTA